MHIGREAPEHTERHSISVTTGAYSGSYSVEVNRLQFFHIASCAATMKHVRIVRAARLPKTSQGEHSTFNLNEQSSHSAQHL
jgi:hypothetical protein